MHLPTGVLAALMPVHVYTIIYSLAITSVSIPPSWSAHRLHRVTTGAYAQTLVGATRWLAEDICIIFSALVDGMRLTDAARPSVSRLATGDTPPGLPSSAPTTECGASRSDRERAHPVGCRGRPLASTPCSIPDDAVRGVLRAQGGPCHRRRRPNAPSHAEFFPLVPNPALVSFARDEGHPRRRRCTRRSCHGRPGGRRIDGHDA